MWQVNGTGPYIWKVALQTATEPVGGYDDWRLPNVRELQSIANYSRINPALDSEFRLPADQQYWSSTTDVRDPAYAWICNFNTGALLEASKTAQHQLRAVRDSERCLGSLPATDQTWCYSDRNLPCDCGATTISGQDGSYRGGCPLAGRFLNNADGTVTDSCTGLMWQTDTGNTNGDEQVTSADAVTWDNAVIWCSDLVFAGHSDWRLPDVRELMSIVDYGNAKPACNSAYFNAILGIYWTNTEYSADRINQAWRIDLRDGYDGYIGFAGKGNLGFLRAVRTIESAE